MKSRQIVTHYLRGWFFCDLLGERLLKAFQHEKPNSLAKLTSRLRGISELKKKIPNFTSILFSAGLPFDLLYSLGVIERVGSFA